MANRRHEILVTAYGLMGTKGLESVHARTVAQEIGVNHATVHYYFPRRSDLICGVADYAIQILTEDRERFQEGSTDGNEKLENELDLVEAYCRKQSRFIKVVAGLYVASIDDSAVRKKMKTLWNTWSGMIAEQIPKSKVRKESPFNDPELLMATLFGCGLASHMMENQFSAAPRLAAVSKSIFGE